MKPKDLIIDIERTVKEKDIIRNEFFNITED